MEDAPTDIEIEIPKAAVSARGGGPHMYLYALDRETIGISIQQIQEWNVACLLRVHTTYEDVNGTLVAKLPGRLCRWYRLDRLGETDYRLVTASENDRIQLDISPLVHKEAAPTTS